MRDAPAEGGVVIGRLAGWAAPAGRGPAPAELARMLSGEDVQVAMDRRARHEVVLGAALCDAASGVSLTLDGTIVNRDELKAALGKRGYAFEQGTDAEVLLRAYQHWDRDAVKHLRGGFAAAIWDARKQRLLLARDRFGERPLFLCEAGATLFFASEARALDAVAAPQVDPAAVRDYLRDGRLAGERTLLRGVRKLAPGSVAQWQLGKLHEARYWSPPDAAPPRPPQPGAPGSVEAFVAALDEAVRLRSPDAAIFLSGGYDSAAILALACRHGGRVRTWSAGLKGDKASELARAARTAKHFGAEHHELEIEPRDLLARLPEAIAAAGGPLARPSGVVLHLLAADAGRSTGAALTGQGADEVLGGYRRYLLKRGPGLRGALAADQAEVDAGSPAGVVEARAPFLDHRFAEHVSGLPDHARVRGLSTKWILRRAAGELFPGGEVQPRKGGMRIRLGRLMQGEMKDFVAAHLRGPGAAFRAHDEGETAGRAVDAHLEGRQNNEGLIWTLLNLEIWHRTRSSTARA